MPSAGVVSGQPEARRKAAVSAGAEKGAAPPATAILPNMEDLRASILLAGVVPDTLKKVNPARVIQQQLLGAIVNEAREPLSDPNLSRGS